MKLKRTIDWHPNLWVVLTGITFIVLTITTLIMGITALFLLHFGAYPLESGSIIPRPVKFLAVLSVSLSSIISIIAGRKVLLPITKLSGAAKEVAKGNFDITLAYTGRIREINEMTQSFNSMVKELSRVETLRNDFLDNVSHELRTPISAIEGYATLLRDKDAPEAERDEYIRLIIDSARQLSTLSANILKLSKLENQEIVIDRKLYRLDEQIREAVLFLENRWSEKALELDIELPKTNYCGNKELLTQVWLNLFDNAIKFTPSGGLITVRLEQEKDNIKVSVKDSGVGINRDDIAHVFEKFYQSDLARKESGNGLGLALVSRIVYLCKGRIDVESEPGAGSKFTVVLPVNQNGKL